MGRCWCWEAQQLSEEMLSVEMERQGQGWLSVVQRWKIEKIHVHEELQLVTSICCCTVAEIQFCCRKEERLQASCMQRNDSWPRPNTAILTVQLQLPCQWPGEALPFLWVALFLIPNAPKWIGLCSEKALHCRVRAWLRFMSEQHYTILAVPAGQSSGYKWEPASEAAIKEQGKLWQLSSEYLVCSIFVSFLLVGTLCNLYGSLSVCSAL